MSKEEPTAVFEVAQRPKSDLSATRKAEATRARRALCETWVPSRFNVAVGLARGLTAIYNTFSGATVIMRDRAWQQSLGPAPAHGVRSELASEALQALYGRGFLVPKGVDEREVVRLHYQASRFSSETLGINLLCTLACNLRCPYCFEGTVQASHRRKTMSRETEEAVVAYVSRAVRGKKAIDLCWFGGEPLLAIGCMDRISSQLISACTQAGVTYNATLVTNATLLSREVVARLRGWRIGSIQVTVDVPRSAKRDLHGRDTLEKVLDNIGIASKRAALHLRVNLTADAEEEFDQLYRSLLQRGLDKTVDTIMIAQVFAPECGRGSSGTRTVEHGRYVEIVTREYAKAAALGLPVRRFFMTGPSDCCSATRVASAAIGPDGMLYKCVEDVGLENRAYGSVFVEGCVRQRNLTPWLCYDWFGHAMCDECPVLPQCAGGCAHKRLFQSDSLTDQDFCYWNVRGDLEERIREYARIHASHRSLSF